MYSFVKSVRNHVITGTGSSVSNNFQNPTSTTSGHVDLQYPGGFHNNMAAISTEINLGRAMTQLQNLSAVAADILLEEHAVSPTLQEQYFWIWHVKIVVAVGLSLFGGYALVGILRDRCKKSEVIWKLTLIVFSAPVVVFVFFSLCAEFKLCERFVADAVSFGSVAGMLLKLVTKPSGEKTVKLIVQQVTGEKHDVWLDSTTMSIMDIRNQIAEVLEIVPASRVSIESGKGKALEDLTQPLFDHIDDSRKSTDFFGFVTASCYITVAEPITEEAGAVENIEWKEKDRNKTFNPFKLLLDSRAKYGDPFMIIGRSATSDDAKKFHISSVDRFAGAAPGNAPLFVQLKILAWSSTSSSADSTAGAEDDGSGQGPGSGKHADWDNSSEVASSVMTASTRKSRGGVVGLFRRRRPDEGQMRGKPIHHGDSVVIECDGKFLSVTRGWWLAWSSTEPRFSGTFEIEIVERAPQNIKLLKDHMNNLRKIGQLGNLNIHIPGTKHASPKHLAPAPAASEAEKVVEQDPSLRPGDMFRLKSVKFPGYELGITSVKLRDEYYYLGLRKIGTSDAADDAWCMCTLFSVKSNTLGVNVINQ